jgi:hypothetical protein
METDSKSVPTFTSIPQPSAPSAAKSTEKLKRPKEEKKEKSIKTKLFGLKDSKKHQVCIIFEILLTYVLFSH